MNNIEFQPYSDLTEAHKTMLNNWIIQIKETLVSIYEIPETDALALSIEGFDDVLKDKANGLFKENMKNWMQNKYNIDVLAAQALAQQYSSGDKGKKCH